MIASTWWLVEVMGGTTLAWTVVLEAPKSGMSVVTGANKALIAEHLAGRDTQHGQGKQLQS